MVNRVKSKKHIWALDENGEIDEGAWYEGYHNGVVCVVCGETICVHCNKDYNNLEDCIEHDVCSGCGEYLAKNFKYCPICGEQILSNKNVKEGIV